MSGRSAINPSPVLGLRSSAALKERGAVVGSINKVDGAWYAVFGSKLAGDRMVLLRNGTLLGCDNQYFYEGVYELGDDGTLRARIKVSHYCRAPGSGLPMNLQQ
jgi:hypothetical protein